jgi:hypothetical protein
MCGAVRLIKSNPFSSLSRGLDVTVKEGAEELPGCVPLHHLTDNASLATMLLETYKVSTFLST